MIEVYHTPGYVCSIDDGKYQKIVAQNSSGDRDIFIDVKPYGFIDELGYVAAYDKIVEDYMGEISETDLRLVSYIAKKVGNDKAYIVKLPSPSNVRRLHDWLRTNDLYGYEMDITYIRRLFIDMVLKIRYLWEKVVFLDIECDDSMGFMDYGAMKIISVAWERDGKLESVQGDELSIFLELSREILKSGWCVIVGWNVGFDRGHLTKRMAKCLKAFRGEEKDLVKKAVRHLVSCDWIDLRDLYMENVKGLTRYSLDEVAKYEGFGSKSRSCKVCEMGKEELKKYNENDVDLMVKLEEKHNLVKTKLKVCEFVNLPYQYSSSSIIWDTLVLRRLRELGYVAPSKVLRKDHKSYSGAYVKSPKYGVHENIACVDFVSLYPSIVIRDKIDVYDFRGEIIPYLMEKFMDLKEECEKVGDKVGRNAYKIIMNAGYGQFGFSNSRFYDPEKAEHITREGRKAVVGLISLLDSIGLEVVYGDTDSCFFKCDGVGSMEGLINLINKKFYPLKIKLEAVFDKILFFGGYDDGKKGVSKKYIGITVDGKVIQRGLETRRRDWCRYTKHVVETVANYILKGELDKVLEYVGGAKKRLLLGEVPEEDLVITKSLRAGEYKREPEHYKLWKKAVKKGLIDKNVLEISYLIGRRGLILYGSGEKPDYKAYWERQIFPALERLLKSAGIIQEKSLDRFLTEVEAW